MGDRVVSTQAGAIARVIPSIPAMPNVYNIAPREAIHTRNCTGQMGLSLLPWGHNVDLEGIV